MAASAEQVKQISELRKRVVRADRALTCCWNNEARLTQDVLRIMNEVIGFIENATSNTDLAFVPLVGSPSLVGLAGRLVAVEVGAPLAVGAVIVATGAQLVRVAETKTAYDVWGAMSTAIGQALSTRKSGCYDCLKKNVLTQSHPRKRETARIQRRL